MSFHALGRRKSIVVVSVAVVVAYAFSLGACVKTAPFRIVQWDESGNAKYVTCEPDPYGKVSNPNCITAQRERSDHYDLLFAEFDDQGWLNSGPPYAPLDLSGKTVHKDAMDVIQNYLEDQERASRHLILVTYVHGWKHNASVDDQNVADFRRLLATIDSKIHQERPLQSTDGDVLNVLYPRVVGIYLGWRGDSVNGPDFLKNVSFYARKSAAHRVATGEIRNILNYLFRYVSRRNDSTEKGASARCVSNRSNFCSVTATYIGHSFGGLILLDALEGKIADQISSDTSPPAPKYADNVVILINPAVEASRLEPLFALSLKTPRQYPVPMLAAITTRSDSATRTFFPLGRALGTLGERTVSDAQAAATMRTIGHYEAYLTHDLRFVLGTDISQVCNLPIGDLNPSLPPCPMTEDRWAWPRIWPASNQSGNRGGIALNKRDSVADFLPIWNIATDDSITSGHSDLSREELRAFVTELVADAQFFAKYGAGRPVPIMLTPQGMAAAVQPIR